MLLILIAFLGYVLVFSQISLWAGIVITGLLSVIPIFGLKLVVFFWGGYVFGGGVLKFFFYLHFILPLFILILVFFHIYFLHKYGRRRKIFLYNSLRKINFFS